MPDSDPNPEEDESDEPSSEPEVVSISESASEEDEDDDEATSGSPTPEPVQTSLETAIQTAPTLQLRNLLALICKKNDLARKVATGHLLTPMTHVSGKKRKAWEKCKHCDEDYNVNTNSKGDCVYHPGEKELYEEGDFWADHDDRCHGDPYSFMDDPTYEDGFIWTCCERLGGEEGCVISRHKPDLDLPSAKRARY